MLVPHTGIARLRLAGWAVLLSLMGWVTWLAATLETGTDTLAQDLHVATFGWLGPDPNRFLKTFPDEQAEFWIDLVQRDVDAAPESVDRLIEGAWLLTGLGRSTWGKPRRLSLKSPLWNVARRGLISRARELAPDDLRVWRNIAYLTAEFEFSPNNSPVSEPTLATLRAAQQHDQDNALYDYLAAFYLDGRSSFGVQGGGRIPHADEMSSDDGQWFLQRMSSVAQLPSGIRHCRRTAIELDRNVNPRSPETHARGLDSGTQATSHLRIGRLRLWLVEIGGRQDKPRLVDFGTLAAGLLAHNHGASNALE